MKNTTFESSLGYSAIMQPVIVDLLNSCGGQVIESTLISDEYWITAVFATEAMQILFKSRLEIAIDIFQSHLKIESTVQR